MNNPSFSSPCSNALPASIAAGTAAGLGPRLLGWWRRLSVAAPSKPAELDTLVDLDARALRDIGWCGGDVRRRVEDLGAPAHRMPNFW